MTSENERSTKFAARILPDRMSQYELDFLETIFNQHMFARFMSKDFPTTCAVSNNLSKRKKSIAGQIQPAPPDITQGQNKIKLAINKTTLSVNWVQLCRYIAHNLHKEI